MKKRIHFSFLLACLLIAVLLIQTGAAAGQNESFQKSALAPETLTSLSNNTSGVSFYYVSEIRRAAFEEYAAGSIPVHVYQITKELTTDSSLPANLKEKAALYKTYYVEPQGAESGITIKAADYRKSAAMENWILNSSFIPDPLSGLGPASGESVTVDFGTTREVNFYFDAPDWEYAVNGVGIGISDLNQTVYTDSSGTLVNLEEAIVYNTMGLFYTASENPGSNQKNDHINYIWLGSDINQNELRRYPTNQDDASVRPYSCFNINKNKQDIVFDGSKDRSHKGGKVGTQSTRDNDWHKWVQWFHYDAYAEAADYIMAVRTTSANTVPFETKIQNSYLVGGNGYGFIFVTSAGKNITNHYSNTLYVGPQIFWNDNGLNILDDSDIIIDDPRYRNNGVINYEDINGNPKSLTLNLNDSRDVGPAYWGEVGEVSGMEFRGNVNIYKTNTGDLVSMFWIRYFTQDVILKDDSIVNLRYKNNNTNSSASGIFYSDVSFNISVGQNAVFNVNADNTFSTPRINNFILENESQVTIVGLGNPGGAFMSISGNLELKPDSEMTVLTTHRNDYRVFNVGKSVILNDYSKLNITGNSNNSAMLSLSDFTLGSGAEAIILNNGYGTALYTANLTADEFSALTAAVMNSTSNTSANVSTIQVNRADKVIFHNNGTGRGLTVRNATSGDMVLTNMESVKHWKIPNAASFDPETGVISGTPTYNWSNPASAEGGFNVTAWVNPGGWIQSADRVSLENYTGTEVLNNTTFSLSQLDGSVWNNKTTIIYKGQTGPFSVTLHWNDLKNTVNGGEVRYGFPVSVDLDLKDLEPEYPYHKFVQWYSDAELTKPFDVDNEPITQSIDLYGKWESDGTVFIRYHANGGTGTHEPIAVTPPATHTVLPPSALSFTRIGYVFSVWNTQSDGTGADYPPGDTLSVQKDTDLYALWVPAEYFISYNFTTESGLPLVTQGSSSNPDFYTILDLPLTLTPASAPGYSFLHWTDENGEIITALNESAIGNRELTAVFSDTEIRYSIVYDFKTESGDSLAAAASANNPSSYTVSETPLVLNEADAPGYTFLRWETESGSEISEIASGSTGHMKLIAVFSDDKIRYEIVYHFKTESGTSLTTVGSSENPDSYVVSDSPLILNAAEAAGYSFLRWENETGAVITEIAAGSTGKRELTAVFSDAEILYSIIYDFKTESGAALKTSAVSNNPSLYTVSDTPFSLNAAAAPGYSFLYWEDETGSRVSGLLKGSTGNKVLTGVFDDTEIVYTITYRFETESGGSLSTAASANNPNSYTVSDTPLILNAASASGYSFLYWKNETNNIVYDLSAGSTGNRVLTAVFSDDESVFGIGYQFETESGKPLLTSGVSNNPNSYTVSDTPFTLNAAAAPGYNFLFWKNESGAVITGLDAGSTGNRKLTAVFDDDEIVYQIRYKFQTESGDSLAVSGSSDNPMSYTVSKTPLVLRAASANGYIFLYWQDETGLKITELSAGSTGDRTLTAVFSSNEIIYPIIYEFKTVSGALLKTSGSSANPSIYTVSETPFDLSDADAPGYNFLYWEDESGSQITVISAGSTGARKLTAVFDDNEIVYSIHYRYQTESGKPLATAGVSDNPSSYRVSDTPYVLNAASAPGYTFLYWSDENQEILTELSAGSMGNRVLTAVFSDDEVVYSIIYKFKKENGETISTVFTPNNPSQYVVSELPITLNDPSAPGYKFLHWEDENEALITEITFPIQAGEVRMLSDAVLRALQGILRSASLSDSLLLYEEEARGKINAERIIEKAYNRELTAVFDDSAVAYNITYFNVSADEHNNPASYTIEDTITLSNASRINAQFRGWYEDSAFTEPITRIGPGMTGDLKIYAEWSQNNSSGNNSSGSGNGTGNGSVTEPSEPGPGPGPDPDPDPGPGEGPDPEPPENNESLLPVVVLLFLIAVCIFLFAWRREDDIENMWVGN